MFISTIMSKRAIYMKFTVIAIFLRTKFSHIARVHRAVIYLHIDNFIAINYEKYIPTDLRSLIRDV